MAVVLSNAEKLALFEILDVPYTTSYKTLTGVGTLSATTSVSGAGTAAAQTALLADIVTLEVDTNGEGTKLQVYLQRWNTIGTSPARIESGNVGDLSNATYSYAEEKAIIKERVKVYTPYFRAWEVDQKNMQTGGINIEVKR